jgi:ElaB/YqjD/DUF883 family membrane-anchored ribosome-binding protein
MEPLLPRGVFSQYEMENGLVDTDDQPDLERIKDKARDVRVDVDELAAESVYALRKAVERLTAHVQANTSTARDAGSAKLDEVKYAVRRNPLTALALAAGAGLILGLWRRRDAH